MQEEYRKEETFNRISIQFSTSVITPTRIQNALFLTLYLMSKRLLNKAFSNEIISVNNYNAAIRGLNK